MEIFKIVTMFITGSLAVFGLIVFVTFSYWDIKDHIKIKREKKREEFDQRIVNIVLHDMCVREVNRTKNPDVAKYALTTKRR